MVFTQQFNLTDLLSDESADGIVSVKVEEDGMCRISYCDNSIQDGINFFEVFYNPRNINQKYIVTVRDASVSDASDFFCVENGAVVNVNGNRKKIERYISYCTAQLERIKDGLLARLGQNSNNVNYEEMVERLNIAKANLFRTGELGSSLSGVAATTTSSQPENYAVDLQGNGVPSSPVVDTVRS